MPTTPPVIACTPPDGISASLELRARRDWLEDVLEGHLVLPARRLANDGLTAWEEVLARGYEGLVAKDPASPYVGGRTLKWLKVKQPNYRAGERGWQAKNLP